jgi:hypothetical protein
MVFVFTLGRETRHAFGRTALVLSGGGSFGAFHLGVVKVRWLDMVDESVFVLH